MANFRDMMPKPDDELLNQISLEMTPERRERIYAAAAKACTLVEKQTITPTEAIVALQFAVKAISDHYFSGEYKGTVVLGGREVPKSKCYGCGADLNMVSNPDREPPEAGAVSVCSTCGAIAIFDKEMHLVKPSDDDIKELENDSVVMGVVAQIKLANERRKLQSKGD